MAANIYAKQSSSFWETYAKGRPRTPESFWSRIFSYHACYGGQFHIVNDLGSGVGLQSPNLGQRFDHVILTDPGPKNLEIARQYLSGPVSKYGSPDSNVDSSEAKYSYILGSAENSDIPPSSLDMVFTANVMHFTDVSVAIPHIASQLRAGGTVIMTLFGMPSFSSDRVQDIWDRMCNHAINRLRQHYEGNAQVPMDRIMEIQDSGYDSIRMSEELFENVKRVKLNTQGPSKEPFRMAQGEREQYPLVSHVGPNEELIHEQDDDWAFDHDLQGVRDLWGSFPFPKLDEALIKSLWQEMEKSGEDGRYKGHWVVATIMAKKRVQRPSGLTAET